MRSTDNYRRIKLAKRLVQHVIGHIRRGEGPTIETMGEEMHRRLNAAYDLVKAGRYDEATEELVWLWENIGRVEPGMEGVRVSFMARNIRELVEKHQNARERFAEIRDRAATLAGADIPGTTRLRFDWIVLNEILSEPDRTLVWFDGVKDDAEYAIVLDRVASRLIPLLQSHERFRDIGRLYRDPVATLRRNHHARLPPPDITTDPGPDVAPKLQPLIRQMLQAILDSLPEEVIKDAALMVTCLIAAGRTADAEAVEREARRLDPSEAMRAALQKARGMLD